MKPFDLETAKRGDPLCTREGYDARIICFNRSGGILTCTYDGTQRKNDTHPIVTLAKNDEVEREIILTHRENGRYEDDWNKSEHPSKYDLFMKGKKIKVFIGIDKDKNCYGAQHTTMAYRSIECLKSQYPETDLIIKEIEIEV